MTITLYAQPYNITAQGFFFTSIEEYIKYQSGCVDAYGNPVEEFGIQYIDGDASINCELFQALNVHQSNITDFFRVAETWNEYDKIKVLLAVRDGCRFQWEDGNPDSLDIDIYLRMTMEDVARSFIEEGLFGVIPENIMCYLDYEAIARDLRMDYSEAVIDNQRIVYRLG